MDEKKRILFERLESMSLPEARAHINAANYTGPHGVWAEEWLFSAEAEERRGAEERDVGLRREEIATTRSAKNAAWAAAIAAIVAAIAAIASAVIAYRALS